LYDATLYASAPGKLIAYKVATYNVERCSAMTSLPLVLDDEPLGIILRAGNQVLRPAKIWAYCWFLDEGEDGDHTHRHLPVDPKV
jgi:hypothetical protein